MTRCPRCNGRGIYIIRGLANIPHECELCNGTGKINLCPKCGGRGKYITRGLVDSINECEYCGGTGIL